MYKMYNIILLVIIHFSFIQAQDKYKVGDSISLDDQNKLYDVCNGVGNYSMGDKWKLSDYNGNLNGGNYKITLISMNASW